MVSRATGISPSRLRSLIDQQTQGMQLGFLGSPFVNVLQLNEALAKLQDVSPDRHRGAEPRRRCRGRRRGSSSVVSVERPWVRTDAEIDDGTGTLVLRFDGPRRRVPGIVAGPPSSSPKGPRRLDAVPLVMRNPLYSFLGEG